MRATPKKKLAAFPSEGHLILALLCEELKSRKFFNSLLQLGLDNCPYQVHLDEIIMNLLGLNDDLNETYDFYYNLIEKHSIEINRSRESIEREAVNVYRALLEEVERKNR